MPGGASAGASRAASPPRVSSLSVAKVTAGAAVVAVAAALLAPLLLCGGGGGGGGRAWPWPSSYSMMSHLLFRRPAETAAASPAAAGATEAAAKEAAEAAAAAAACPAHSYSTTIVSLDPLLIYVEGFLRPAEAAALLAAGEPAFAPSVVYKNGRRVGTADRTSQSAALPRDDAAVGCVLARAEAFLGTLFDPSRDDVGPPQLVRYAPGQRFNQHHDWYDSPQPRRDGMRGVGRAWNRVASFFAVLEDGCTGGETWFPHVDDALAHTRRPGPGEAAEDEQQQQQQQRPLWRRHEDGGLAFRPVAGNSLFWVNLHANGTGDDRVVHAGLPVETGQKTAMNIWPRKFYD
ncbi:hypothetical protein GGR56DRAFT_669131 [Xylariaceae sp. FL0804]|nr:hypothetical protein GGR56DRAFT_669131 [Xylariaceae sp. FL0804]